MTPVQASWMGLDTFYISEFENKTAPLKCSFELQAVSVIWGRCWVALHVVLHLSILDVEMPWF